MNQPLSHLLNKITHEARNISSQEERDRFIVERTIVACAIADSENNNPDHDESDPTCLNHTLVWHFGIKL